MPNRGKTLADCLAEQITAGLEDLAVGQFLQDFVNTQLFEGIDLSDSLGADELAVIQARARDARITVDALRDAFGEVGAEVDETVTKVDELFQKLRDLTQQRFDLRLDVIGNLESIGALTGVQAAQAQIGGAGAAARAGGSNADGFYRPRTRTGAGCHPHAPPSHGTILSGPRTSSTGGVAESHQRYSDRLRGPARESATRSPSSPGSQRSPYQPVIGRTRPDAGTLSGAIGWAAGRVTSCARISARGGKIQGTINQLVTSASPFSRPEQLATFQRQAAELRGQIAGAPREEQAALIEQLSTTLSEQLTIGKEFLDPTAFANLFTSVVGELETLRDQSAAEGDRAEVLQQQIADTTLQMDASLKMIDLRIEQARIDAQAAQQFAQQQAEELSRMEQAAVAQAEQESAAALDLVRIEVAQEIRNLAVIEDQILAAQFERAQEQANLTLEQVNVLHSIDAGVNELTSQFIRLFDSIVGAQQGYDGVVKGPQLFLAHQGEHVKITPAGQGSGTGISVSVSVPIQIGGAVENPRATEEAIIQAIADDIRKGGKVRRAIQGGGR